MPVILSDQNRRVFPGSKPKRLLSGHMHYDVCGARMFSMREYLSSADQSHPYMKKHIIEPHVLDAITTALLSSNDFSPPALPSGVRIAELVQTHTMKADAVRDTPADPTAGSARRTSLELETAREKIETDLEHAHTENSAASSFADRAADLLDASELTMPEWGGRKSTLLARFGDLSIDRQSEIVRTLVHV